MSFTLLFDLDDTLIDNSMEEFLPAYLKAISSYMAPLVEPSKMIGALLTGTKMMLENHNPECTLRDVFYAYFYPTIGLDHAVIDQAISQFYIDVFPKLQALTRPRPEAVQVVDEAFKRGYQIAIATNPLFPLTAVRQRLAWAGFNPEQHPFAFIPSIESVHFAKPNPACLAEIMAQIGWPEGPVVMIGDDLKNDIQAASNLGIASYWLTHENQDAPIDGVVPTAAGNLEGLMSWLDSTPEEALHPEFDRASAMLAILRATPAALNSLAHNLPAQSWAVQPRPGEWSLTEIICHLRDVDTEVNLQRLHQVLEEANPFIPGKDTDRWAEERVYINQDGVLALLHFNHVRRKIINLLVKLSPQDWQRPARHAIFGPTNLQELVSIIIGHDRLHIHQVFETIEALLHLVT